MKSRVHYTKPSITSLEIEYANDAVSNGWGEKCYDYIDRFEYEFKSHLDVKYAIATSSCTGALHMGLSALGIRSGDEVIMADTNWIATAAPVVHLGAKPVFVDILPETWCLDPSEVERAITKKTKAIIAVHLYGNLCEMNRLLELSEHFGIPIIEDAAEAIGSEYCGRKAGSMGTFGTFSFHGSKTLTTGEGGMFVTNNADIYEDVLTLSNHGRSRSQKKQFWPNIIGFKYKMSNVQAAIGCAQLKRLKDLVNRKQEILCYYMRQLSDLDSVKMNPCSKYNINGAWMPNIVFHEKLAIDREEIKSEFERENIDARVFFYPLSSLPMFEKRTENVNAWSISERSINLPSFHDISQDEMDRVVKVIKKLIGRRN